MKTAKTNIAAVLLTAAFLSPTALAGGDGRPCFWKGGGHEETTRTVAETPAPEAAEPAPDIAEPIVSDENFVVRLDENGEPMLPEAADAELPAAPELAE